MRFGLICLVVIFSLLAMPWAAQTCVAGSCVSHAITHDLAAKDKADTSDKSGKNDKMAHAGCHSCVSSCVVQSHDQKTESAAFTRQDFAWTDILPVQGRIVGPLLKPPSHA